MSDPRYITRLTEDHKLKSLNKIINECPANYKLHSVVPVHGDQHGTSYFYVVFAPLDFGNAG